MSEKPGADTPPSVADLLDGDRLLTIEDVAKRLNVVKKTVQNWISNGTLPAVKLGRDRYVLRSKLQGILERKMREAEEEASRKQQEEARRRELAWLLEHEPEQEWAEVTCPGCLRSTNTSREQRLDRRIFCEACQAQGVMANYTKEQAHRLARVEVDERNRLAREDLDLSDQETRHNQPRLWEKIEWMRTWRVIRCGECQAPLVVKIGDILDPAFIPHCDHGLPFGQGIPSINDDNADFIYQGMLRKQVSGLAQIEAQLRTGMMEDYDPIDPLWAIYPCASCGTSTASTPQMALIGGARCRLCFGEPIKHAARIDAIIREIRVFHPEFNVETKRCLCQHVPDVAMHGSIEIYGEGEGGNKEVLLSWCSSRPIEERERWVRTYAARVGLDMPELAWLLDDVGDPASSHQDRPLLVRPASAS